MENIAYIGELLSLITAAFWAFAVILFTKSGETVHPLGLNLFKNTLAFVLILVTLAIFKVPLFRPDVAACDYLLLMLSGAIGIGLGDTLFFLCLNLLGAGLTAIINCLYSPFIIALSVIFLGEQLTLLQLFGVAAVIAAILVISLKRGENNIDRRTIFKGLLLGISAMLCMAVGVVIFKPLLDRLPFLWVTEIRLLGGLIALVLIIMGHPAKKRIIRSIMLRKGWPYMLSSSFIGAYLAMLLWLAGMKYTQASVASVLNQTSNVFIVILAFIFLKEKLTYRRILGISIAFIGAVLVSFG
ncbi:DMT family transporter [bacterium]|nr:DMT family transporter [bacterium]